MITSSHLEKYHMKLVVFDSIIYDKIQWRICPKFFFEEQKSAIRLNIGLGIVYSKVCGLKEILIQICFLEKELIDY